MAGAPLVPGVTWTTSLNFEPLQPVPAHAFPLSQLEEQLMTFCAVGHASSMHSDASAAQRSTAPASRVASPAEIDPSELSSET
jgi:hypothetical protein